MNLIPLVIKIILNIVFYVLYAFIAIVIGNFIYWFVLTQILDKPLPWTQDIKHYIIAVISILFISILSFIFRKYFYIRLKKAKKTKKNKNSYTAKKKWDLEINID